MKARVMHMTHQEKSRLYSSSQIDVVAIGFLCAASGWFAIFSYHAKYEKSKGFRQLPKNGLA